MDESVRQLVRERAGNRCEYCGLRQEHAPLRLQVEHIIARKHGGSDHPDNLALACDRCNLHKGSDLTGIDPETDEIVRLFDPRRQRWEDHFTLDDLEIRGLTPCGRATAQLLQMNVSRRLRLRAGLQERGELD